MHNKKELREGRKRFKKLFFPILFITMLVMSINSMRYLWRSAPEKEGQRSEEIMQTERPSPSQTQQTEEALPKDEKEEEGAQ